MENKIPLLPGHYYHIFNRGNNRENIFIETRNYEYFFQQYIKYIEPVAETLAYCLLRNHFHVLVLIREYLQGLPGSENTRPLTPAQVLQAFTNFFNAYAKGINQTYQRTGSLFQKGFHRVEVTTERQFMALIDYIHRNPQKHGFTQDYRAYPYSSYGAIISTQPTRIQRQRVLAWFGSVEELKAFQSTMDDWKRITPVIADDD